MALEYENGEPTALGYIVRGIIVVILLALALFILYEAFFGNIIVKYIFWGIVSILAIIGAFYGIGRLVHWLGQEYG